MINGGKKQLRRPPHLSEIFSMRGHGLFLVTFCTKARQCILDNDDSHRSFKSFCEGAPEIAGVWIGRYVLMPDHIHAFVSAEGSPSLIRWVGGLKRQLTKALTGKRGAGPFWQQGFFDHLLRNSESYSEKWNYVWNNPVRKGLVGDPEAWPYAGEIHDLRW